MLSATINRYAYGSLRPRDDRRSRRVASTSACRSTTALADELIFDGKLDLVKAAIRKLGREPAATTCSCTPTRRPGSGLGSSSAMMVALIGLLQEYHRLPLTDYEIAAARLPARARRARHQGRAAGPVRGDLRRLQLHRVRGRAGDRQPAADLRRHRQRAGAQPAAVLTPGKTRASTGSSRTRRARYERRRRTRARRACARQKELAVEMKNALLRGRLNDFGELLGEAWEQKKKMSPAHRERVHRRGLRPRARARAPSAARSPAPAAAATCSSTARSSESTASPRPSIDARRDGHGVRIRHRSGLTTWSVHE